MVKLFLNVTVNEIIHAITYVAQFLLIVFQHN